MMHYSEIDIFLSWDRSFDKKKRKKNFEGCSFELILDHLTIVILNHLNTNQGLYFHI